MLNIDNVYVIIKWRFHMIQFIVRNKVTRVIGLNKDSSDIIIDFDDGKSLHIYSVEPGKSKDVYVLDPFADVLNSNDVEYVKIKDELNDVFEKMYKRTFVLNTIKGDVIIRWNTDKVNVDFLDKGGRTRIF